MIKCFIKSFLILLLLTDLAFGQAAVLLQGVTQFFDNNGNPLTSGTVDTYIPGTTTRKTTWQDGAETILNTNPIILDAAGRAIIYGQGTYREVVKDSSGNLIWDAVTTPGAANNGNTNIGDGNLVGTILPWAGINAPNQYAFAVGQELDRTTFVVLFTAITQSSTVACSSGSPIVSGLTDTTNLTQGTKVELSCVVPGTTVLSKTSSTVTLSNNSSVNLSATAVFFPYGNGNGSTTFNIPDLRGVAIFGNNQMGGLAGSRIDTTTALVNPNGAGAAIGLKNHTLTQAELPNVSFAGSGNTTTTQSLTVIANVAGPFSGGGTTSVLQQFTNSGGGGTNSGTYSVNTSAVSVTSSSGGSGTAFTEIPPGLTINYVIKTTPDISGSGVNGVASIGGMQGVIACGTGLLCTGNTITVTGGGGGGTVANPTGTIGLTAINGILTSALRSDGAPALSQAIVPTWTGTHTFTNQIVSSLATGTAPFSIASTTLVPNLHVALADLATVATTANGVAANSVSNAGLATAGAATLKGNPTSGSANITDFTISGLVNTVPDANLDFLVYVDHVTSTFKRATPGQIAGAATAGVSSLNGLTGALSINGCTQSGAIVYCTPPGFANRLRNSSLTSWFHGSGTLTITTAGAWCLEGIYVVPTGASITCARNANGLSNPMTFYSQLITGNTSVSDIIVRFVIESQDAAVLAGQQVTCQFPVLNNTGGSITPTITVKRANTQDATYTNVDINAQALQTITNTSTGILAYSWAANANSFNGLSIDIDFGNNFNTNGKSIQIGGGFDCRATPGASNGQVSSPPLPEIRTASDDINWNNRFYQTSYNNGTTPGTSTNLGRVTFTLGNTSSTTRFIGLMRAIPLISLWDTAGNANAYTDAQTGVNAGGVTTGNISVKSFEGSLTSGSPTTTFPGAIQSGHFAADASLTGG